MDKSADDRDIIAKWTDPAPEPAKVGLPDGQMFSNSFGTEMACVWSRKGRVWLDARAEFCLDPANARALAAALTAYADLAEDEK
jgi:hypothetical protein